MKLPTPREIGLPEQFDSWRPKQEDGLYFLRTSTSRVKVPCAPTGYGKTAVYVADAILSGLPTAIVTSSRGLQDQLVREFAQLGMVDLRGKANYKCRMRPDYTCEDGQAGRCPYSPTMACPETKARSIASVSRLVVTNYSKWTRSQKAPMSGLEHIQRVVFDEGHEAFNALAQAVAVDLSSHEIEEMLGLRFPIGSYADDMREWKPWAQAARTRAGQMHLEMSRKVAESTDPKPAWVKKLNHLRNLVRRLSTIALCQPDEWVVEQKEVGYVFDPIWPGKYAETSLFMRLARIVIISATIRPKTMHMLGLSNEKFDFKEFDSDFDPTRCPIYWIPTMRVDAEHPDSSLLWLLHDQIATQRRDRKGIVQSVSFDRQKDVRAQSRYWERMILNEKGEAPTRAIEDFDRSPDGSILVSPSVGTGYDFKGRRAEWQLLCKVPFEPPSKILKARSQRDKEYRIYNAVTKMVQIFGRIMRDKKDRGENFIGDDHIEWVVSRYGHLAPKSFHGFFKKSLTIPPAPPRVGSDL